MFNVITLVIDLADGTKTPLARGSAMLAPSVQLTDIPDQFIAAAAPVQVPFGTGSPPSFPQAAGLAATDNTGPLPSGWGWGISFPGVPGSPAPFSFFLPAGPCSFTASNASPCVFTWTPTPAFTAASLVPLPNGTGVQLSGGPLPAGFTAGTAYYAVNSSGSTFQLAAAPGGPPLASTGAGSGNFTAVQYRLSALTPVSSVTAMQAYMPLPSGTPQAGQAPVATGSGQASAWTAVTEWLAPSNDTSGATDTAAISTAIARGFPASLGPGTFWQSATLAVTVSGTVIEGAGSGLTTLKAAAGMAGLVQVQLGNGTATIADCSIYDLLFDSAVQKTGNAAIDISKGFRTKLQRFRTMHQYVSVHVHNSTITSITDADLRDQSADSISYDCDLGAGFDLYVTNVSADNPDVTNSGNGINWTGGENLVIQNCDFEHFAEGLLVAPSGGGRQCRWGFFTDAEFDTCSDNNVKLSNASGDIAGLTFANAWAGTAANYGVLIDGSGAGGILAGVRFAGSKIVHNGLAGVRLIAGATQVSITDTDIISNSQANSGVRSGIEITAGTQQFIISGNQVTNGLGQGSTQANGVSFDSGATDYFLLTGNNLHGNTNAAISNQAGVTGTHFTVANNIT